MIKSLQRSAQLGLLSRDFATVASSKEGARREKSLNRIVERLGLMKGLPQKVGQLLAFSEIESSNQNFIRLTESESEISSPSELFQLEAMLGAPLDEMFSSFDPEGVSASIGRVYRAALPDGRQVAIKVQHPDVAEVVEYDLRALGWITVPLGGMKRGFDMDAYRQEIGESLRSELNYRAEAENLREFARLVSTLPGKVIVPEVIAETSNERVLTTTWLHGEHLSAAIEWPLRARETLARTLLDLFFFSVLDWGILHADPHPGNYRFMLNRGIPAVGLLDFGCVKRLSGPLQSSLQDLVRMGVTGDFDATRILALFEEMGFDAEALKPMGGKLGEVGAILLEPFACHGSFDVSKWRLGERLKEALGDDRMTFRTSGPSDLVFILRSFQGLAHYLKLLKAPVNWRDSATSALPVHSAIPSEQNNISMLRSTVNVRSERLCIQIHENGVQKVALAFGAKVAANLRNLIPGDLMERVEELKIDLEEVEKRVVETEFQADELILITEGARQIRIWLE